MKLHNINLDKEVVSIKEPQKNVVWVNPKNNERRYYIDGEWQLIGDGGEASGSLYEMLNYLHGVKFSQKLKLNSGWNWPSINVDTTIGELCNDISRQIRTMTSQTVVKSNDWYAEYNPSLDEWIYSGTNVENISASSKGIQILIDTDSQTASFEIYIDGYFPDITATRNNNYDIINVIAGMFSIMCDEIDIQSAKFSNELKYGMVVATHAENSQDENEMIYSVFTDRNEWSGDIQTIKPGVWYRLYNSMDDFESN